MNLRMLKNALAVPFVGLLAARGYALLFPLSIVLLPKTVESANTYNSYRCPNGKLVSIGDSISVVAVTCDAPSFKASRTESAAGEGDATILINIEEWTYNEGPQRLIHILTFRNGVLERIDTGGYGK